MSNNQVKQGFGNVQDVDRSGIHPEVERRYKEIQQVQKTLSPDEIYEACAAYAVRKWQRLRNENPSMRAGNGDEKENPKKQ